MNNPESTDSSGRGAGPRRRGAYEPQPAAGSYDLLDFPRLPPDPDDEPAAGGEGSGADGGADAMGNGAPATGSGSGLRVSSDAEATARLLIKLPSAPPQPSTTLRPHAAWEDRGDDGPTPDGIPGPRRGAAPAAPFAQVAASPARPSALPSELAALTTATLVVPLPRDSRPTPALLTTTLPPDKAAQANAAALAGAFHDTLEQVFGLDFDAVSAADVGLESAAAHAAGPDALDAGLPGDWFRDDTGTGLAVGPDRLATLFDDTDFGGPDFDGTAFGGAGTGTGVGAIDAGGEYVDVDQTSYEYVPGLVPAATFGGPYGVPTQPAAFPGFSAQDPYTQDPGRHALALRYLGGIFHDSSGESSYLDPGSYAARALHASASAPAGALAAAPAAAPDAPTEQISRIPAPPAAGTHAARRRDAAHDDARAGAGRHAGNRLATAAVVLVAGFALAYGLALVVVGGVFGGNLPRGTVVGGVPVGGLSPAAAESAVTAGLGARSRRPVPILIGQTPTTLDPATAGLSLDAAATVRAAQQDRTNPLVVIPALFGATHNVDPVASVDTATLGHALAGIAASYNSAMIEGRIAFQAGVPVVTAPKEGRGFSVDGAMDAVRSGYLRMSGPIQIPMQTLHPKATPAALQAALEQLARPAVAGPITLATGGVTTQLTPTQIGDVLTILPDDSGRMVPHVDGTRLRGYLGANALAQEQPAVNASFTIADGRPVLVPARDGRGFAPDVLAAAVLPVLTQTSPRIATVPVGNLPAAFSTADAQALGVTDVLGSSSLSVPGAPNRFTNVERATGLIAGNVIQPADTWSFLKTVGAPTAANGFAVSTSAQRAGVDPSGGVDTVATAVFGAAFASGMADTQHHPHASYIDRYPVGLDAAVVAPGTDLQWTNIGDHPVYLYASYANGTLTVALLGEKRYDEIAVRVSPRTSIVEPSWSSGSGCGQGAVAGFQVEVTRTLLRGGSQVGTERYHVTYVPQGGSECAGSTPNAGSARTGGSTTSSGGPASGSSDGTSHDGGSAPSSPAPSPSSSGILGGLLH